MAQVNFTMKEMAKIAEALMVLRKIEQFSMGAIAATEEERYEAEQSIEMIDGILGNL